MFEVCLFGMYECVCVFPFPFAVRAHCLAPEVGVPPWIKAECFMVRIMLHIV